MENWKSLATIDCFVTFANSLGNFDLPQKTAFGEISEEILLQVASLGGSCLISCYKENTSFHVSGQDYLLSTPAFPKQGREVPEA